MPGQVIASASMSLDGFVAHPDDTPGPLFDWYESGEVEVPTAVSDFTFHLTPVSAEFWRAWTTRIGALVVGRRLFDLTDGWRGRHPIGVPVVVVTHEPPTDWSYPGSDDFTFVATGIDTAVATAREIAGDADVGVAAGEIASQCLDAGLLDAVAVDLIPVVLGRGRPYFTGSHRVHRFGNPTAVVAADRVIHLVFPVERANS